MKGVISDARRRSASRHVRQLHYCVLCDKLFRGNGARSSHERMHERRNELVQWGKPGDKERDHYKLAKYHAREAADMRKKPWFRYSGFMERRLDYARRCLAMAIARRGGGAS